MAFELHRREPLGQGIARVFQREAKKAAESGRARSIPATVHELRQRIKKMRAILRLVRSEIGDERFALESERLRDIGRQLSDMRDAEVRLRTLEQVLEDGVKDKHRFRALHREFSRNAAFCTKAARALLNEIIFQPPEPLPLERLDSKKLSEALEKTYRRARKALRIAHAEPTVEHLHDLRKRSKDLWHILRLLQCAFAEVLKPQAAQFKRLSRYLGEYLDLALLFTAVPKNVPALKPLIVAVKTRQLRSKRASLDFADLCLAEKPKKFAARTAAYFPANRCGTGA